MEKLHQQQHVRPSDKQQLCKSQTFLPRWRCSRAEFLREMWTHLSPGRPRSLCLAGLHRSLQNPAPYGSQSCQELLQWGLGHSWTGDGRAGGEALLLPSLCPLQVPASSPTRASLQQIQQNIFLPSDARDKSYLSHSCPMIPLHCLALRSRLNASPWGAEVRWQNRLLHLLTDASGDAPD